MFPMIANSFTAPFLLDVKIFLRKILENSQFRILDFWKQGCGMSRSTYIDQRMSRKNALTNVPKVTLMSSVAITKQ
jgi:hypothetical protein